MWKTPQMGRLLVLAGNNGNGKTMMAKAVRRWVALVGGSNQWPVGNRILHLEAIYWHWPDLLDRLKGGQWDLVDDMIASPCLIMDELGGGHDPSRVGVDKLCQILSHREFKWTMITTNLRPEAWEDAMDRRVASRLFRNSTLIDLSDVPDYSTL